MMPKPSAMPKMAMRTIILENVRLDLKEIRPAINEEIFNFLFLSIANMLIRMENHKLYDKSENLQKKEPDNSQAQNYFL
jgi:hypothetical protein